MNIGIFGNTNNYPYLLATGLRELGVGVKLVVSDSAALHRPQAPESDKAAGLPDWIFDASAISEEDFVVASPRIGDALNFLTHGVDAVILNGLGPSLHSFVECPAISLLTGSDLTYYADFDSTATRAANWDPEYRRSPGGRLWVRRWQEFIGRQRDGILGSRAVSFGVRGLIPEGDRLLDEIGVPNACRMFVYMSDTNRLNRSEPPKRQTLRVLNGARLNWVNPLPPGFNAQDAKGTDTLLHGFAKFIGSGGRGELLLVTKGLHVSETRALVGRLGLESNVTWLNEMNLGSFREAMVEADVVCDQLSTSFPGMTALDAMAIGRPVIANFRPEAMGQLYSEPWPVCHAQTADDVAAALTKLAHSRDYRLDLGARARTFAERHLSPEANARACLARLGLTSSA